MATTLERSYNARRMRNRVRLQRPVDENDFGGRRTWTDVAEVWGELQQTARPGQSSGMEVSAGGGTEAIAEYLLRLRYRSDVASEWRVVDIRSDRVFYVHGPPVVVEERYRWLDVRLTLVEGEHVSASN